MSVSERLSILGAFVNAYKTKIDKVMLVGKKKTNVNEITIIEPKSKITQPLWAYLECKFPMNPHVHLLVGWSVSGLVGR